MNPETHHPILTILCFATLLMMPGVGHADDWPGWRGPEGNNHAPKNTDVPLRWDVESGSNIVWKTAIPGRGHSSPVVVKDAIFLTTAETEKQTQSLLKFDRESGRLIDQWELHRGKVARGNAHGSMRRPLCRSNFKSD